MKLSRMNPTHVAVMEVVRALETIDQVYDVGSPEFIAELIRRGVLDKNSLMAEDDGTFVLKKAAKRFLNDVLIFGLSNRLIIRCYLDLNPVLASKMALSKRTIGSTASGVSSLKAFDDPVGEMPALGQDPVIEP